MKVSETKLSEALAAVEAHETLAAAARALNIPVSTLRSRVETAQRQGQPAPHRLETSSSIPFAADLPPDDIPTEEIISLTCFADPHEGVNFLKYLRRKK